MHNVHSGVGQQLGQWTSKHAGAGWTTFDMKPLNSAITLWTPHTHHTFTRQGRQSGGILRHNAKTFNTNGQNVLKHVLLTAQL
jgi:hypothetical protein